MLAIVLFGAALISVCVMGGSSMNKEIIEDTNLY